MSKINRHPVRRTAAGVLAGALALSGAVAAATPAFAGPGFALERVAGENRYETSAAIAAQFGATSGAILASGETGRSVDALSANFLAGVQGVPVLLTQRDRIPASVLARLNALTGAKNVTIVGGTVAVSAAVETQLRTAGFTVTRLGGADRYATSEEIIKAGASSASPIGLVASGTSFPDALAGGPLSYKGKHPVFLTNGGGLPQDTIDAMVAAGTRQVIILGGTAAVPASVEAALAARNITVVTRLGGAGRSETSRIIADYLITSAGFTNTTFNVASGVPRGEGVDALSGAALSGKENRALLVTDTATAAASGRRLRDGSRQHPQRRRRHLRRPRRRRRCARDRHRGGRRCVGVEPDVLGRAGRWQQRLPGRRRRVPHAHLHGHGAGRHVGRHPAVRRARTSRSPPTAPSPSRTPTATTWPTRAPPRGATITSVNGVPGAAANAVVSNGTVTFTVEGTAAVNVVPVIFADTNNDNRLNLTAPATANNNPKTPSEAFAIGAASNFLPALAAFGNQGGATITLVSAPAGAGFFTVRHRQLHVRRQRRLPVPGRRHHPGAVRVAAGAGATVLVNFNPSAAGVSTFNVQTSAPRRRGFAVGAGPQPRRRHRHQRRAGHLHPSDQPTRPV